MRKQRILIAALVVSGLTMTACSGNASTKEASSATDIRSNATLTVVDYPNPQLSTQFALSGQAAEAQYQTNWVTSPTADGVPQMLQLGQADLAWVPEGAPAVAGVGANAFDVKIVAVTENPGINEYLAARPGAGIASVSDLAGRNVGVPKGTVFEALTAALLAQHGMSLDDINVVDIPTSNLVTNLVGGNIDAALLVSTLYFIYKAKDPGAVEVANTRSVSTNQGYLLAASAALSDPAKAAAIRDFVGRAAAANVWVDANRDTYVQDYFVDLLKAPAEVGYQVLDTQGIAQYVPITDSQIRKLQEFADLEAKVGILSEGVSVDDAFDLTFDAAIGGPR